MQVILARKEAIEANVVCLVNTKKRKELRLLTCF